MLVMKSARARIMKVRNWSDSMFRIGEFASLNRVSTKLLRHYDAIGLLKPEQIDTDSGYRYYSATQIAVLNRIMALKDLGFSLTEISGLLKENLSAEEMIGILKSRQNQIRKAIAAENERLGRIDRLVILFKQEVGMMNYDIVVKPVEGFRVASLRGIIGHYGEQGPLWEKLGEHLRKHHAKIMPGCFVTYYGEIEGRGIDAEVVEPIDRDIPAGDGIKVELLPDVEKMAAVVHKGPYESLNIAYAAITRWMEENGYRITGQVREIYLKGDWDSDNSNEYVTEIQLPVTKD